MTNLASFMKVIPVTDNPEVKAVYACDFPASGGENGSAVFDIYNRRLKLYTIAPADYVRCLTGREAGRPVDLPPDITKVTVYARPGDGWRRHGFEREAIIRGFFADGTDAWLWALYTDLERGRDQREEEHMIITKIASAKAPATPELNTVEYTCCRAVAGDAGEIAALLLEIFPDYPSPLTEEYIRNRIEKKISHFRFIHNNDGAMVAAASAEIDHCNKNAEMTDCATRPSARGQGLMAYLLWMLENDLQELYNITDLYTIARADEVGMNCVFSKLGYIYDGRLVNNCRMPNGWESMNVWCRQTSLNG